MAGIERLRKVCKTLGELRTAAEEERDAAWVERDTAVAERRSARLELDCEFSIQ